MDRACLAFFWRQPLPSRQRPWRHRPLPMATPSSSTARPTVSGVSTHAPEARQACADSWEAAPETRRKLADLIGTGDVTCEPRGHDRYRRTIALCRADGQDLGAAMVSAGMAYAFTRYSGDYVEQEKVAIGARAGVHAHDCEKPWDWRARNRATDKPAGDLVTVARVNAAGLTQQHHAISWSGEIVGLRGGLGLVERRADGLLWRPCREPGTEKRSTTAPTLTPSRRAQLRVALRPFQGRAT